MARNNAVTVSMPTKDQVVLAADGTMDFTWWRFLFGLFKRSQADIPFEVGGSLSGAGTTQGTATVLENDWNEVTLTPVNSGVLLPNFGAGFPTYVWNEGANVLRVYPPLGMAIDGLAANAPYGLAATKMQVFCQITPVLFRSLQLG